MKKVTKKGQKFKVIGRDTVLTVYSFFGFNGIQFNTLKEAEKSNPKGSVICIKNKECKESSNAEDCFLI